MKKKNKKLIIIAISIILILFVSFLFIPKENSSLAKLGEPCGFDFQKCENGLFCHVAGISESFAESPGTAFGYCKAEPNYLGEIESCGLEVLACCGEGLVCATQPNGQSYCFTIQDNQQLKYPLVDKECY